MNRQPSKITWTRVRNVVAAAVGVQADPRAAEPQVGKPDQAIVVVGEACGTSLHRGAGPKSRTLSPKNAVADKVPTAPLISLLGLSAPAMKGRLHALTNQSLPAGAKGVRRQRTQALLTTSPPFCVSQFAGQQRSRANKEGVNRG